MTQSTTTTQTWTDGVLAPVSVPTNVSDYTLNGQPVPVYDAYGNVIPPNTIVPTGTYISIGQPPTGTSAGGVVENNGSSILSQGQQWQYDQGELANQAQSNANDYALGVAQVEATYAQTQEQLQQAQANYTVSVAQIQEQYSNDVAQFGLSKAQDLYQARLGQAQLALQTAQAQQQNAALQLQVAQANASQRQAQATAYQNALQMMASRTGPQDEIAYQRLVAGMGAPTPTSSTTLDPFAYIKQMYQPINIPNVSIPQAPSDLGASAIAATQGPAPLTVPGYTFSPVTPPNISTTEPSITGATSAQSGANSYNPATGQVWSGTGTTPAPQSGQVQTQPQSYTSAGSTAHWMQDANGNWALVSNPAGANGAPETSGQMVNGGGTNRPATTNTGTTTTTIPGVTRMDKGGLLIGGGPIALVGDGPGETPSRNAELAQAMVDRAGKPVLKVTPPSQTRSIISAGGLPVPAISGLTVPRADTGGTFGTTDPGVSNPYSGVPGVSTNSPPDYGGNGSNGSYGTALNYPTMTFNQYSPSTLGSQPFYEQLTGQMGSRPFGAFGASISNPQLGINNAPTGINYRTYNYLLPSQQSAFQSLYGQGLGINPADIVQEAQNAAPTGMYTGYVPIVASHYGG